MAVGADYSFELIFNETCAPQFNGYNNSFLASVNNPVSILHGIEVLPPNGMHPQEGGTTLGNSAKYTHVRQATGIQQPNP